MSILYTALPQELIMQGSEEASKVEYFELPMEGGSMVLEPLSLNQFKIVRIISSDPALFMKPELQPGTILTLPLELENKIK